MRSKWGGHGHPLYLLYDDIALADIRRWTFDERIQAYMEAYSTPWLCLIDPFMMFDWQARCDNVHATALSIYVTKAFLPMNGKLS
jgi:hypothetical protein